MKIEQTSVFFLKVAVALIAVCAVLGLAWFPQTEGRAVNLDLVSIYTDPFILYIYLASTTFFIGLCQAFRLLHFIEVNQAFSQGAVNACKNMKLASVSLIGFILLALVYIRFFIQGEDPAGPTAIGLVLAFAIGVVGTAAGVFQKLLQNAVDIKSENDLTV